MEVQLYVKRMINKKNHIIPPHDGMIWLNDMKYLSLLRLFVSRQGHAARSYQNL